MKSVVSVKDICKHIINATCYFAFLSASKGVIMAICCNVASVLSVFTYNTLFVYLCCHVFSF